MGKRTKLPKQLRNQVRELSNSQLKELQSFIRKQQDNRYKASVRHKLPQQMFLYVLFLQGDRYYVGITNDIDKRFKQHLRGKGSEWTRIHKPLVIGHRFDLGVITRKEAEAEEDAKTIEYIDSYGINRVRGGKMCYIDELRCMEIYNAISYNHK